MAYDPNRADRRLMRIETRLTNFGRYMGFDLTEPPAPNAPEQPVFIDDGAVYITPATTVSEIMHAVLRYQDWHPHDTEVPVIAGRRTVMTINPHDMRATAGE